MASEPIQSMPENLIKIEFNKDELPYNTRLTLNISMLRDLIPILQPEILKGLVDTAGEENVILHLHLTEEKLLMLNRLKKNNRERKIA